MAWGKLDIHIRKFYDIRFGCDFLDITPKAQVAKEKGKLHFMKIKKNKLCIKRHYPQSKKATHRMGENIYKSYI